MGGGGESTTAPVPAINGKDAIVDRVVVDLRDDAVPTTILASQSAPVQSDGDVVATDGVSPVAFNKPPGSYHISVLHRNHLGVMTLAPLALGDAPTGLDFRLASTPTNGTEACMAINGTQLLWSGDVTFNGHAEVHHRRQRSRPHPVEHRRDGAHGDAGEAVAVDA